MWCGTYFSKTLRISFRWVRTCRCPKTWSLTIDGASESKNSVRIKVTCKSKNSMSINTSVFKVDSSATVLANDDLELVVPSVGAGSDLDTFLDLAGSAEHVAAY